MKTAALALLGLVLATGCGRYVGGAEPIAPAVVKTDDGWITVASTATVRQRNLADCGAAVLAMMAGHWEVPLSLDDAARALPPPSKKGVRLADLRSAARALGLIAFAVQGDQAILVHELALGRPVIVGLLRPYKGRKMLSHFEVVIALHRPPAGQAGGEVEVVTIDPGSPDGGDGWLVRRWSELEAEWKPAGRPALVVVGSQAGAVTSQRR